MCNSDVIVLQIRSDILRMIFGNVPNKLDFLHISIIYTKNINNQHLDSISLPSVPLGMVDRIEEEMRSSQYFRILKINKKCEMLIFTPYYIII